MFAKKKTNSFCRTIFFVFKIFFRFLNFFVWFFLLFFRFFSYFCLSIFFVFSCEFLFTIFCWTALNLMDWKLKWLSNFLQFKKHFELKNFLRFFFFEFFDKFTSTEIDKKKIMKMKKLYKLKKKSLMKNFLKILSSWWILVDIKIEPQVNFFINLTKKLEFFHWKKVKSIFS